MKNSIYFNRITIALTILSGIGDAKSEAPKRTKLIPNYNIVDTIEDVSLGTNESIFELQFDFLNGNIEQVDLDGDGQNVREIIYSRNDFQNAVTLTSDNKLSLSVTPGKHIFKFYADSNYFEISTDSINILGQQRIKIHINFMSVIYPIEMDKPVIYFYPEKRTQIEVKLEVDGVLGFTYPNYNEGWSLLAEPDGQLTINGNKHSYLFWEAETDVNLNGLNTNRGFMVKNVNLISFFEDKLSTMGLNNQETEDFITYWGPLMSKYEKTFIHFLFTEECNQYSRLTIDPKPDHLYRVFMLWSEYTGSMVSEVKKQELPLIERQGFSVVEWGGSEVLGLGNLSHKFAVK